MTPGSTTHGLMKSSGRSVGDRWISCAGGAQALGLLRRAHQPALVAAHAQHQPPQVVEQLEGAQSRQQVFPDLDLPRREQQLGVVAARGRGQVRDVARSREQQLGALPAQELGEQSRQMPQSAVLLERARRATTAAGANVA